jgi:hypothetical protein
MTERQHPIKPLHLAKKKKYLTQEESLNDRNWFLHG